jgi:hypothetical protein
MKLTTFLTYLKYVLRHKYYVYVAGRGLGVPRFQLLIHDLSKLTLHEFLPYAVWFNQRPTDPVEVRIAENDFNKAWLSHIHSNPHHWQHWILRLDSGGVEVLRMEEKYVREMVADWIGVGLTIGKGPDNAREWYLRNRETMSLHPQTRNRVEVLLGVVDASPNSVVVPPPQYRQIGAN